MLEKIQKRAISMVSNFKSKSYEDKLKEAGMITLEARRKRGDMLEMFKIMTGKENVDSSFWFETLEDHRGSGMSTRNSSGLYNVHQPSMPAAQTSGETFSVRVSAQVATKT